jgi:hypothetical protein
MPGKPTKGEMAQSTIERQRLKNQDTLNKVNWILRLYSEPSLIPNNLTKLTLSSLAAYKNKSLGLNKLAYNTFKSHVNSLELETGVSLGDLSEKLAHLSKPHLSDSEKKTISKRETITSLKTKLRAQKNIIVNLTNDILDMHYTNCKLSELLKNSDIKHKRIQNIIRRHHKAVGLHLAYVNKINDADIKDET